MRKENLSQNKQFGGPLLREESPLLPDDREYVIAKLAEMLVNDYQQSQQYQYVIEPTAVESLVFNGKAGGLHRTADPFPHRQRARSIGQSIST